MNKKLYFVLCLLIPFLGACKKPEPPKEESPKLEVTSPLRKDTAITKEYVSQIHAYKHIER